jgi:hypothetical protein
MIRIHLVRQVQTSHCDVEAECKSLDVALPELEALLDSKEDTGSYGSRWIFVGIERLAEPQPTEAKALPCNRCGGSGEVTCDSVYHCEDPDDGNVTCPDCGGQPEAAHRPEPLIEHVFLACGANRRHECLWPTGFDSCHSCGAPRERHAR